MAVVAFYMAVIIAKHTRNKKLQEKENEWNSGLKEYNSTDRPHLLSGVGNCSTEIRFMRCGYFGDCQSDFYQYLLFICCSHFTNVVIICWIGTENNFGLILFLAWLLFFSCSFPFFPCSLIHPLNNNCNQHERIRTHTHDSLFDFVFQFIFIIQNVYLYIYIYVSDDLCWSHCVADNIHLNISSEQLT